MAMVSESRCATEATASFPSTVRSRGVLMGSTESIGHAASESPVPAQAVRSGRARSARAAQDAASRGGVGRGAARHRWPAGGLPARIACLTVRVEALLAALLL